MVALPPAKGRRKPSLQARLRPCLAADALGRGQRDHLEGQNEDCWPNMAFTIGRWLVYAAILAMVTGCQTNGGNPSPRGDGIAAFPAPAYERAAAQGESVYDLDPARSKLRAYIYRAGPMARQGHSHVIVARDWQGALVLDADRPDDARLDLRIPVAALEMDPPAVRESLGGAFGSDLTSQAREGTRDNMLGPELLMAKRYPAIAVSLADVTGELPRPILTLRVSVRDRTARVPVPVAVTRRDGQIRAEGRLILRHSQLGLTPFSAFGGALRVAEPITIEFDLVGERRAQD